jgi:hypothetical protein
VVFSQVYIKTKFIELVWESVFSGDAILIELIDFLHNITEELEPKNDISRSTFDAE